MKELLVRLQRKAQFSQGSRALRGQVELAVGKSNMLGVFEVELDGVQVACCAMHSFK